MPARGETSPVTSRARCLLGQSEGDFSGSFSEKEEKSPPLGCVLFTFSFFFPSSLSLPPPPRGCVGPRALPRLHPPPVSAQRPPSWPERRAGCARSSELCSACVFSSLPNLGELLLCSDPIDVDDESRPPSSPPPRPHRARAAALPSPRARRVGRFPARSSGRGRARGRALPLWLRRGF